MVNLKRWISRKVEYHLNNERYFGRVVKIEGGFPHNEIYALQTTEGDLMPLSAHGRYSKVIANNKNTLTKKVRILEERLFV